MARRRFNRTLLVVAAALLLGAPAEAAGNEAQDGAEAIIAAAEHGALAFEANAGGEIAHKQSGMRCTKSSEPLKLMQVAVFPVEPLGNDVACDYVIETGKLTIYATRLRADFDFAAYVDQTLSSMIGAYPDAAPVDPPETIAKPGIMNGEPPMARSYAITFRGQEAITSVWMGEVDGWAIKVRATYAPGRRKVQEAFGSLSWLLAARGVEDAR